MKRFLKRLASCLPIPWQQYLKRIYYARQIRHGRFTTNEKDFELLDSQIKEGDCVLDIGENIGHYTMKLSGLVGPEGRVFAFEPISETFEILNSNVQKSSYKNITMLNIAVSDHHAMTNMDIPSCDTGLNNYYMAHLSDSKHGQKVYCLPIDALKISFQVALIKVDVEGHELAVLRGARQLLERDHPTLIVEANDSAVITFLKELFYCKEQLSGSPNWVFRSSDHNTKVRK
jgi:FkbM family methyltransferase